MVCAFGGLLLVHADTPTDRAWSILKDGVRDKSAEKRAQAVSALGLIAKDRRAIDMAEQALDDPKSDVRAAAVGALGELNSKASLPKIKALLPRSDAKTVVAIAAVLKMLDDPEGYEIYYEILTGARKAGGGILSGLKDRASLEKMGIEEAIGFVPFGGIGLGAYNYFKQNDTSGVSAAAAAALAADRDPKSEKALVNAVFGGKEIVQVAALRALAKRGDPSVVPTIQPAMFSERALVSYTAAATVAHLSTATAPSRKH